MSLSLLTVERVVLESLESKEQSIAELKIQTGFSSALLNGVLHLLISKGIIKREEGYYLIDWQRKDQWIDIVKNRDGMKAEFKELFSAMIDKKEDKNSSLKIQKIWLAPREKKEIEEKLRDIERYISEIREKRKTKPVREKTIDRQVIFFGHSPYESLIDGIIKSA